MDAPAVNPYLRQAILPASPQQLQLMLFEGATRFATQARDAIQAGRVEQAHTLLTRAQQIVCEMSQGLRHEAHPELCSRMAALYAFIYNKLVEANVRRDMRALQDALLILGHQRETWHLLMEKALEEEPAATPLAGAPLSG
jgi:flagellar protein FliS